MRLSGAEVEDLPSYRLQLPIMGVRLDLAPRNNSNVYGGFGVVVLGQDVPRLLKVVDGPPKGAKILQRLNQ